MRFHLDNNLTYSLQHQLSYSLLKTFEAACTSSKIDISILHLKEKSRWSNAAVPTCR